MNHVLFSTYLKDFGIYLSRFNLYLISEPNACKLETSKNSEQENEDDQLVVSDTKNQKTETVVKPSEVIQVNPVRYINISKPQIKPNIEITYFDEKLSSFSEVRTRYSTTLLDDVKEAVSWTNPEVKENDNESIDPFNYGFKVRKIKLDQKTYLSTEQSEDICTYIFPQSNNNGSMILHHPNELWGYDQSENFILAVIASCHGEDATQYIWYKNGDVYKSGPHHSCIQVKECGIYHVKVSFKDFYDMSQTVQIGLLHMATLDKSCSSN